MQRQGNRRFPGARDGEIGAIGKREEPQEIPLLKPLQLSFRKAGRPQALLDFGFRQLDLESIPRRPDGLVFPHELIDPLLGRADGVKTKTLRALQGAEFAEQGENRGPRQVEGLRGQFVIRFQRQGALGEPLPDGVVIRGLKMQGPAQRLGMIDDLNIDGSGGGGHRTINCQAGRSAACWRWRPVP